jgi:hypothetical protein
VTGTVQAAPGSVSAPLPRFTMSANAARKYTSSWSRAAKQTDPVW